MRVVNSKKCIDLLRKTKAIPEEVISMLEQTFNGIVRHFNIDEESAHIEEYGHLVYIEEGDNVEDLSIFGFDPDENGLLGSIPEFVKKTELKDGSVIYTTLILYSNEFAGHFLVNMSSLSALSPQAVEILDNYCE